jgi:hypothetical protein
MIYQYLIIKHEETHCAHKVYALQVNLFICVCIGIGNTITKTFFTLIIRYHNIVYDKSNYCAEYKNKYLHI